MSSKDVSGDLESGEPVVTKGQFRHARALVRRVARRYVDEDEARDCVGEFFLRWIRAIQSAAPTKREKYFTDSWIVRCAICCIFDFLRRKQCRTAIHTPRPQREEDLDGLVRAAPGAVPLSPYCRTVMTEFTEAVVSRCHPDELDIAVLQRVVIGGETMEAVAADLGVSPDALSYRKRRFPQTLGRRLTCAAETKSGVDDLLNAIDRRTVT